MAGAPIDEFDPSITEVPEPPGRAHGTARETTGASLTFAPRDPSAARRTGTSVSKLRGSTSGSNLRSEADVAVARSMNEEECLRARNFAAAIGSICFASVITLPFLGGNQGIRIAAQTALAIMLVGSLVVFLKTRNATVYPPVLQRVYGLLLAVGCLPVAFYLGPFSPVSCVITLGVFFVAASSDRIAGVWVPMFVVGSYLSAMMVVGTGLVPDYGLVQSTGLDPLGKAYFMFAAPMVLGYTVWMAHKSRLGLMSALRSTQTALLHAAARDAQLEEAQQNFDRALRAIVGRPGRYTGVKAGSFELAEIIGLGAMGEVYATVDEEGRAPVAVKMMQAASSERADLVDRFRREIDICQRLSSPHVVRTLEYGVLDDGSPFLAMERLRGKDLSELFREQSRLSVDETIKLVEHVAAALDEAHAAGIIHRDIKPQNVFASVSASGPVIYKVLDFGISKLVGNSATLTHAELVGTPAYMSPEQVSGRDVGSRSDVFSLAAVAYRSLTGQPAFSGANVPEKLFSVAYRMPEAPSNVAPELSSDIDDVMAIALAKRQQDRFATAGAFAEAFARTARQGASASVRERARAILRDAPWGKISPGSPGEEKER